MGGFPIVPGAPNSANLLFGVIQGTASAAAANILSIPAGRAWVGTIIANCAVQNAGANPAVGQATGVLSFTGAGVIPVAGNTVRVTALCGANVAAGTDGDGSSTSVTFPLAVFAPTGNAVQVQVQIIISGTGGEVNFSATGFLQ